MILSYRDMTIDQMVTYIRKHAGERRIVFTNGCFDILHPGHLDTIRFAYEVAGWSIMNGDGLVVAALNSDASVARLKGANRPIMDEDARARLVEALVDIVVVFDQDDPYALLEELMPHAIVKGGDYSGKQRISKSSEYAPVFYAPYDDRYSTTKIIEKCRQQSYVISSGFNFDNSGITSMSTITWASNTVTSGSLYCCSDHHNYFIPTGGLKKP